jgi:hypothetical protein
MNIKDMNFEELINKTCDCLSCLYKNDVKAELVARYADKEKQIAKLEKENKLL